MVKSIAIVAGSFHKEKVETMILEAKKIASKCDIVIEEVCWVPWAMEVPLQLKRLLIRESVQGAVVLGIIERGQTKHGQVMGQAVTQAIIDLQMASMKPIGYGIIGPDVKSDDGEDRLLPYASRAVTAVNDMLSN